MKSISKWISPILPRGASNYFDEKVFKLINYFNVFFISALFLIYVTDISTMALSVIEPATTIPGIFSFMLERYQDFESVEPGRGAFFVVANIVLLAGTIALLIAILSRFIRFKERLPAKFTKYNITTILIVLVFILVIFRFLFFADIACGTCGTIASRSLNTPLIIVIVTGFYSVLIEFFVQIFCAGSIALTTEE
ncbi:hypothetical protein [Agrobacterium tumefaciens]|uniref:hypothetical protein n=1 Tax=Agrobacterium tumefaciens TaxID=358 RepID=UPI00277D25F6|nr:hypothetical protein [Agrobacterium tumefaciens]MDP9791440.1 hypothetical protein [Agrobacterium tumefaciens]